MEKYEKDKKESNTKKKNKFINREKRVHHYP